MLTYAGHCRIITMSFKAFRLTVVVEPFSPFPDRDLAADCPIIIFF